MKKIKKAFVYGLIVTVVINGLGFLAAITDAGIEPTIEDFKRLSRMSIALFFVPSFLSVLFYSNDILKKGFKGLKKNVITALISFVIVYAIIYVSMMPYAKTSFHSLSDIALHNATLSIFILLFSNLFYYIINTRTKTKKIKKLNFIALSKLISIPIIMAIIFFGIPLLSNNPPKYAGNQLTKSIIYHIITSIITCFSFFYIYRNFVVPKKLIGIIVVYFFNIILLPIVFLNFEIFKAGFLVALAFSSFIALMLTLAIHTYFIYLINKQEKLNLKQTGIEASQKYQHLKSQISPHFLFNNLSVLTGLIEENPKKAILFSEDLSYIYRHFLEQEQKDLVRLSDALKFAKTYLNLLEHRFENAIEISFSEIKNESFYLIPLALQQVLENIVKHNEISLQHKVKISLTLNNDYLIISNTKNPKLNRTHSTKTGLLNIKERYAYFTETKVNTEETNTSFSIMLPLLTIEA